MEELVKLTREEKDLYTKVFDDAVVGMLSRYPLHFGIMLNVYRHVERLPDIEKSMDPRNYFAATWFEGTELHMEISRQFIGLSPSEKVATLVHELEHIFRRHLLRVEERERQIWLYATDVAINQDIEGLPDGVLTLETFAQPWKDKDGNMQPGVNLPSGLSAEEYYELLKQFRDQNEDKLPEGDGGGLGFPRSSGDDGGGCSSGGWKEMSDWERQKAEEGIRRLIEKSAEAMKRAGIGLGSYASLVDSWMDVPNPWKAYINRFVASVRNPDVRRTWHRVNRHNTYWKGARYTANPCLLLVFDTSGSVSDSDLGEFLGHMEHIRRSGVDVWVMQCDYGIQSVEHWTGGDSFRIKGRGGTSFMPPFEWLEDPDMDPQVVGRPRSFDGVIYLTDGYGDAPDTFPVPTLWGITKNGQPPHAGLWSFTLPE